MSGQASRHAYRRCRLERKPGGQAPQRAGGMPWRATAARSSSATASIRWTSISTLSQRPAAESSYPGRQLCGAELDRVRPALGQAGEVTIACTAQAPLFREAAEDAGDVASVSFVNIRETAGWASEGPQGRPEDGRADRRRRRTHAADRARLDREPGRRADLWPRRAGDRGRPPPFGPARRHRDPRAPAGRRRRRAISNSRSSRA